MDKYGIDFSGEVKTADTKRLINQLWELIPMRENDEDWKMHFKGSKCLHLPATIRRSLP